MINCQRRSHVSQTMHSVPKNWCAPNGLPSWLTNLTVTTGRFITNYSLKLWFGNANALKTWCGNPHMTCRLTLFIGFSSGVASAMLAIQIVLFGSMCLTRLRHWYQKLDGPQKGINQWWGPFIMGCLKKKTRLKRSLLWTPKVAPRQFCFHFSGNSSTEQWKIYWHVTIRFLVVTMFFLPNSVPNPENNLLHHIKDFANITGPNYSKKMPEKFPNSKHPAIQMVDRPP